MDIDRDDDGLLVSQQDVFDFVARHLLWQNKKSLRENALKGASGQPLARCSYRGDDGLQCAVGCLIADSAYTPALEGAAVTDAGVVEALKASNSLVVDEKNLDLLGNLQDVHDDYEPYDWRIRLAWVAGKFDLDTRTVEGSPP
jgi:hypothetical protein